MRATFRLSGICVVFFALCWPVLAQGLPGEAESQLATARAQAADGNQVDAIALLRGVVNQLPREHPTSRDARILLCQLRAGVPEAAPTLPLDLVRGEHGGDIQIPERLLAPDPRIEQRGCAYTKGVVLVEVTIDQDGCVVATRLLTSAALLQVKEAALETLKDWVYLPALSQGKAVASRLIEIGRVSPGPMLSFSPQEGND